MKRLLIVTPVAFLAGYILMFDHGAGDLASAEYMLGRFGSGVGSAVNAVAAQFSALF